MLHIPGKPKEINTFGDHTTTHVRVMTCKSGRGGLFASAKEVTKTAQSWECMLFTKPQPWENLGTSTAKCTENNVAILHGLSLAKLKELRPELFPPTPGDRVKRHTPAEGVPNPSFKVLEVRDGILVTDLGEVPASEYMVVRITEEQPA